MNRYILLFFTLLMFVGCKNLVEPCGDFDAHIESPDKTVQVNEAVTLRATAKSVGGTVIRQEWRNEDGEVLGTTNTLIYYPDKVGKEILIFEAEDDSHDECVKSDNVVLTVVDNSSSNSSNSSSSSTTNINSNSTSNSSSSQNDSSNNSNSSSIENLKYEDIDTSYSWTNGTLGAKVVSLKKESNWIIVTIVFKNLSNDDIRLVSYWHRPYLFDENSNRWEYVEDSANIKGGKDILPNRQLITQIKFKAKDSANGTTFDLIFKADNENFNFRIYGIKEF